MRNWIFILISLVLLSCNQTQKEQIDYIQTESQQERDARMQWWKDAKFGMFIHWGGYAELGGVYDNDTIDGVAEWLQFYKKIPAGEYASLIKGFNPTEYDPQAWAKLASDAGMQYMVITSKHHEGMAMWDSEVTNFDIVDFTPYGKDALQPLADACRHEGVKFCTYYSILDWHYPEANKELFPVYRDSIMIPQLNEIMDRLDPEVMWFDGEWIEEWTEEQGKELYNHLRNIKPELIINNRVGKGRNGMQGMNKDLSYAGDFGTPEQEILEDASSLQWESCMTMNNSWGYKHGDNNWKSTETLVHNLIDVVAKGGNFLLNVGPDSKGRIPEESITRLKEMGQWLQVNGESIYSTVRADFYKESEDIRYTASKDKKIVYASVLRWPGKQLNLKYFKPKKGTKVFMLGYKHALQWSYDEALGLTISLPDDLQAEKNRPCQHAWVFKFEAVANEVCATPDIRSANQVNPKHLLFTNKTTIHLDTETHAVIYYTTDGTEPNTSSRRYTQPIEIDQSCILTVMATSASKVNSSFRKVEMMKTENINNVDLRSKSSVKYSAEGPLSLVDKLRGSENFQDNRWLGIEGEDFEVIIDLGEVKPLKSLRAGFLHQSGAWIFLPQKVIFSSSMDGKTFSKVYEKQNTVDRSTEDGIIDIVASVDVKARYIKVYARSISTCPSWHAGAGAKAWLFVDEIVVE